MSDFRFLRKSRQYSSPKAHALAFFVLLFSTGGEIPRELDRFLTFLGKLHVFSCGSNRWVEPPVAVLGDMGIGPAVRSYFVDLYREERVVSRSLKVVLVGKENTGKTRCRQMFHPSFSSLNDSGATASCLHATNSTNPSSACKSVT